YGMASVVETRPQTTFDVFRKTREALLSTLLGVGVMFLVFLEKPEAFGWRLATYGALTGFSIYFCCRNLHRLAGPIYRRQILPHSVAAAIVFSIGGEVGWGLATIVAHAIGLIHFHFDRRDLLLAFAVAGGLAIVVRPPFS